MKTQIGQLSHFIFQHEAKKLKSCENVRDEKLKKTVNLIENDLKSGYID
jgi:hypothetical protein